MTTIPPVAVPLRWRLAGLALSGVGAVTVAAGLLAAPAHTWPNLLIGNSYLLGLALAGAVFISIQYLSGASWWVVVRRVAEAMMTSLPVVGALALTLFFGRHSLYPWAAPPGALAQEGLLPAKALYLSSGFVFARMVVVLGAWVLLVRALRRASLEQDDDPAPRFHRRLVRLSAVFIVFFALSFSMASVDWLMSLDPHWYSTLYAAYLFAGLLVSGLAVLTLTAILLRRLGPLRDVVAVGHLHDLGKLLFAFSTFWAYIWLCQYLLIWYGNLPEETTHYVHRTEGAWLALFLANLAVNWVIPFLVLLPRATKRHEGVLAAVCVLLLFGRWLDLYLLVMPEVAGAPRVGPLELLIPAGYAGLFFLLLSRGLAQAPLLPRHDPHLLASLRHDT